jgi:hypothetical protein
VTRWVKLGEFDALDTVQLLNILIEQFPECEFKISRGKTIELFSLISSCEKKSVSEAIMGYFEQKLKVIELKKTLQMPLFTRNSDEESCNY